MPEKQNSINNEQYTPIKIGTLAALLLAVAHLTSRILSSDKSSGDKDAEIAALHGRLAEEDATIGVLQGKVAQLQKDAGQEMPEDMAANIQAILDADLATSQPADPPPANPPTDGDPVPTGNPYETLTPGTQVPASVNVPTATSMDTGGEKVAQEVTTGSQVPASGAITGDLPGNAAPVTGSNTSVGDAPPVQQGTENVEGSKLTPGNPAENGQAIPDAVKV